MARRHLTPKEIAAKCNAIARQRRIATRSPWTALSIVSAYALHTTEKFQGKKLQSIVNDVTEKYNHLYDGDYDIEDYSKRLMDKAGWTIQYEKFSEKDIHAKKGSIDYFFLERQIDPCNDINELSTAYLLLLFNRLIDMGYGEKRLTRIKDLINTMFADYQEGRVDIDHWEKVLADEAGIAFGRPIDPITEGRD